MRQYRIIYDLVCHIETYHDLDVPAEPVIGKTVERISHDLVSFLCRINQQGVTLSHRHQECLGGRVVVEFRNDFADGIL